MDTIQTAGVTDGVQGSVLKSFNYVLNLEMWAL